MASGFDYRSVNNFPDAIYSLFADKGCYSSWYHIRQVTVLISPCVFFNHRRPAAISRGAREYPRFGSTAGSLRKTHVKKLVLSLVLMNSLTSNSNSPLGCSLGGVLRGLCRCDTLWESASLHEHWHGHSSEARGDKYHDTIRHMLMYRS